MMRNGRSKRKQGNRREEEREKMTEKAKTNKGESDRRRKNR